MTIWHGWLISCVKKLKIDFSFQPLTSPFSPFQPGDRWNPKIWGPAQPMVQPEPIAHGPAQPMANTDVNWKWWDKCLYSNFDTLERFAKRPNCPTSGVIWPGEWGYLVDLLFWGRKLMLWASQFQRQQWRLFCTHYFRLTPCRTRFRTLCLRSVLSEFNISRDWLWTLDFFLCRILNHTFALIFMDEHLFLAFDAELLMEGHF